MLRATVIGFYDSLNPDAIEYVCDQSNMQTIMCSKDYMSKLIKMRRDGLL